MAGDNNIPVQKPHSRFEQGVLPNRCAQGEMMGNCRICGAWVQDVRSSAINDLCSKLSCVKKAHPELFKGPWFSGRKG